MTIDKLKSQRADIAKESLASSPFQQLNLWLQDAVASGMQYPTAMTLATLGEDGRLDQRTVLLKHCDLDGLVFFSGSDSKKIHDLLTNPQVSLHFLWRELDRQVRISGRAEKLNATLTTHYFIHQPDHQKPRNSIVENDALSTRHFLIEQFEMMRSKFYGGAGRTAGHWCGYRVIPDHFEFWQGGGPRLRDRFVYRALADGYWEIIASPD